MPVLTKKCHICEKKINSNIEYYPSEEAVLCGSCFDCYYYHLNRTTKMPPSLSNGGFIVNPDSQLMQKTANEMLSRKYIVDSCAICESQCFKKGNVKYNCCARCSTIVNFNLKVKDKIFKCLKDGLGFAATKHEKLIMTLKLDFKNSKNEKPCNCIPWYCVCKTKWDSVSFTY